jgi:hypothetical protein
MATNQKTVGSAILSSFSYWYHGNGVCLDYDVEIAAVFYDMK